MGMIISPVATEGAIRNATEEAIYDRSFRLRKNQGQVKMHGFLPVIRSR